MTLPIEFFQIPDSIKDFVNASPGLILRPRPSYAQTSHPAVLLGGKPQLPAHLDWPASLAFYAQIDLTQVPRNFSVGDTAFQVEHLPDRGTLFLFLPLHEDGPYRGQACVFYCEEDVTGLPEREPPETLGDFRANRENWSSYWIDTVGVSDCGRLLYRQQADLIPFVSVAFSEFLPDFDDLDAKRVFSEMGAFKERLVAHALTEHPLPKWPSERRPTPKSMAYDPTWSGFRSTLEKGYFCWEFIFEWARQLQIKSYDLGIKHISRFESEGQANRTLRLLKAKYEDDRDQVARDTFARESSASWRTMFARPKVPTKGRFDEQAKKWLDYARGQTGDVPPDVSNRFFGLLEDIEKRVSDEGDYIHLSTIDDWCTGHGMDGETARKIGRKALHEATQNMTDYLGEAGSALDRVLRLEKGEIGSLELNPDEVDAYWDSKIHHHVTHALTAHSNGGTDAFRPPQLFGVPRHVQEMVEEYSQDYVLLAQIENPFGTPISAPDGNFQIWMRPDDLQNLRFDKVHFTYVTS